MEFFVRANKIEVKSTETSSDGQLSEKKINGKVCLCLNRNIIYICTYTCMYIYSVHTYHNSLYFWCKKISSRRKQIFYLHFVTNNTHCSVHIFSHTQSK